MDLNQAFDWSKPFVPQVGLVYVRGCEVEGMLDDQGKLIEEGNLTTPPLVCGALQVTVPQHIHTPCFIYI